MGTVSDKLPAKNIPKCNISLIPPTNLNVMLVDIFPYAALAFIYCINVNSSGFPKINKNIHNVDRNYRRSNII